MVRDLTDKNLMFLHFLLDILDVIETASLEFQKRYGLLVDQAKNLESLTSSLIKIKIITAATMLKNSERNASVRMNHAAP